MKRRPVKRRDLLMRNRDPLQRIVNRMTNWQRNQWARAGYPRKSVKKFAALIRRVPWVAS